MQRFDIRSPKLSAHKNREKAFPYYAGFSEEFAIDVLKSETQAQHRILDPWNGSGTTTYVCKELGIQAHGFDLNPVMVLVSKARSSATSHIDEARNHISKFRSKAPSKPSKSSLVEEPLTQWFDQKSAETIRDITSQILDLENHEYVNNELTVSQIVNSLPEWQTLALIAIFVAVKKNARSAKSSNPTWIKSAGQTPPSVKIDWISTINEELTRLENILSYQKPAMLGATPKISIGNSEKMSSPSAFYDFILGSPPYCTRIDYAKATLVELAVIGLPPKIVDISLRKKLMGTTAIHSTVSDSLLAEPCLTLLDQIKNHPSSGSKSYYYKNFKQYFDSLQNSISEMARVLKPGGRACIVLQGSHYKEIAIDLPAIFSSMAELSGFKIYDRLEFNSSRTFGTVNTKSLKYKPHTPIKEQAIFLVRNSVG